MKHRLRDIVVKHVKELNPEADHSKMDALEHDIKVFVKTTILAIKDLGLEVKCESFIGDFKEVKKWKKE